MQTMLFTAMYMSLIPICMIFTILGLIIQYWVIKHTLINKRIVTHYPGSYLD
jgi:hypothetical protein